MSIYIKKTRLLSKEKIADSIGIDSLYFKMEKDNPSGTHKDKAFFNMMEKYTQKGVDKFTMSTSGNAAISAVYWIIENNRKDICLDIFVSKNIDPEKEKKILNLISETPNTNIHKSDRPKTDAIRFSRENNSTLLRTSVDELSVEGYKTIGQELYETLKNDIYHYHIFIPTSSGATFMGIYKFFIDNCLPTPFMHVCQTSYVHPIAKYYDKDFQKETFSLATGISDMVVNRRKEIKNAIKDTKGAGWVIENDFLEQVKKIFSYDREVSEAKWESILTLASLIKSKEMREDIEDAILLFTA